jgi:hypothetical protein
MIRGYGRALALTCGLLLCGSCSGVSDDAGAEAGQDATREAPSGCDAACNAVTLTEPATLDIDTLSWLSLYREHQADADGFVVLTCRVTDAARDELVSTLHMNCGEDLENLELSWQVSPEPDLSSLENTDLVLRFMAVSIPPGPRFELALSNDAGTALALVKAPFNFSQTASFLLGLDGLTMRTCECAADADTCQVAGATVEWLAGEGLQVANSRKYSNADGVRVWTGSVSAWLGHGGCEPAQHLTMLVVR